MMTPRAALARLAVLAIPIVGAPTYSGAAAASVVEFADDFSAAARSRDINPRPASPRQSGLVGRLDYVENSPDTMRGGSRDALTRIGDRAAPGALLLSPSAAHSWVGVSPDHDSSWLRNAVYEADVDPLLPGSARAPDHWAGLVVGAGPCAFAGLSPAVALLVSRQTPEGLCQVLYNGEHRLTSARFTHHPGPYRLTIRVTGGTAVAFLVDGVQVYAMTITGALPAQSYVTLASYGTGPPSQLHAFDNLRVTALVPGPTERSPQLWMIPSPWPNRGRCLRELAHRDSEWTQTRARVDGIGTYATLLDSDFSDRELRFLFGKLRTWGKLFALEVPAIKPDLPTAAASFARLQPRLDRFTRLGVRLHHLALDEPYHSLKNLMGQSLDYSADGVAQFICRLRAAYPGVLVGDIEPYPALSLAELQAWLTGLNASLALRGTGPLDFIRLDVDWGGMAMGNYTGGSWTQVKALEAFCRAQKVRFSLIYWASDYPLTKGAGYQDTVDNLGWYCGVMSQGGAYASVGGLPDEYVVESWTEVPEHAVPETDKTTFSASVLDFYTKYLVPRR